MSNTKKKTWDNPEVEEVTEAVTDETKEEPKKNTPAPKAKEPKKLMYVGPTIRGLGIQNRVYTDIPDGAKEAIAKTPELRNLFIEVKDYPKANRMIREQNGYIFSAYVKALELK